jgi:crossover junction endodeoxyribonuclease RusA
VIRLVLPYPPSVNRYWRNLPGSRVVISAEGRQYRAQVIADVAARRARDRNMPRTLHLPVAVSVRVHAPDRRVRDLDNLPKAVLDALTHARVWEDDSLVDELHLYRCAPMRGGSIAVSIDYAARELAA